MRSARSLIATDQGSREPIRGYHLLTTLAQGGMGVVYLASRQLGEHVELAVIKRPNPGLMQDPSACKRFYHETLIATLIEHPHLVRTLTSGEDDQGPFIILPYIHGLNLLDLIDRVGLRRAHLSIPVVLVIAKDCLSAIDHLHRGAHNPSITDGAVHRDICPSNILLSCNGLAFVSDFGIAKSSLSDVSTDAQYLLGRLAYLSPEYLTKKSVSAALDVYALGITLFTALCGQNPLQVAGMQSGLPTLLQQGVSAPSVHRADIPTTFDALITQMCAVQPASRPTAYECAQLIDQLLLGNGAQEAQARAELQNAITRYAGIDLANRWYTLQRLVQKTHGIDLGEYNHGN